MKAFTTYGRGDESESTKSEKACDYCMVERISKPQNQLISAEPAVLMGWGSGLTLFFAEKLLHRCRIGLGKEGQIHR